MVQSSQLSSVGTRWKTARREAKQRVMTPLLASTSESFQQWFVMRLLYFTLIWPPQLERPLKSLLGNTTHVVRSFQLLYYSNKQLLFVTSKLPHPSSPPQQTMRWALISFKKDKTQLWSKLFSNKIGWPRVTSALMVTFKLPSQILVRNSKL